MAEREIPAADLSTISVDNSVDKVQPWNGLQALLHFGQILNRIAISHQKQKLMRF